MTNDEAIRYLDGIKPVGIHMEKDIYMLRGEALSMAISALENQRWIPCSERLPECEQEVWIQTNRGKKTTAMYEDGKMPEDESEWNWNDIDFDFDEKTDTYLIPEGWWEYRHFNPDDVYNCLVDEEVVAWMLLPEAFTESVEK